MPLPLKPLHPDSSLSPAKLYQIGRVPTEILLHSLLPGQKDSLKTRPDGAIPTDIIASRFLDRVEWMLTLFRGKQS